MNNQENLMLKKSLYQIGPFEYYIDSKKNKKIFTTQSIEIQQGEFVLITGHSGSGKSTLLKMLKGLIPEYSRNKIEGNFLFQKNKLSGVHFKENLKEILFLFQNPFSQIIHQTVPEEFYFSMENMMFSKEEMLAKKVELNQQFELERIWKSKTKELSNGECQKLVLASMIAVGPQVLLFDEPTAFLDPTSRQAFYKWLLSIRENKTIIIVDHHVNEVMPIIDKIIKVQKNGEIQLITSQEELHSFELINNENVFLIETNLNALKNKKIKLSDLSFSYDKKNSLLQNINCEFNDNEIIVIKGQNGRGKSTLFKLISNLIKPTSGSIEISLGNTTLNAKNIIKNMGFVFQNPEMHFFYDTIKQELQKLVKSEAHKDLLSELLSGVDMEKSPFLLSEGEKRRLSILLLILMNKSFYLYDEPTFGQDKSSIIKIVKIIKKLQQTNVMQLIISHDEEFIKLVASRVFELKNNSLVEVK